MLGAVVVALSAGSAWAQMRTLPANAKRATLTGHQDRMVALGGEQRRLAPGAVIFDTSNRTILPNFLPAQADVVYTTDPSGAVMRIYILTPQERTRLDQTKR